MAKISVRYVVSGKCASDGRYPIKLYFTYKRRNTLLATGLYAREEDLTASSRGASTRVFSNRYLKRKVEDLVRDYEDAALELDCELVPDWNVSDVVGFLSKARRKDVFTLDFPAFCEKYIKEKEKSSHQAALNYSAALKRLCEFRRAKAFDISIITSAMMREWESWLRLKYPVKNGREPRAISLYTSAIRAMHCAAQLKFNSEEMGAVRIRNPFAYYKPPKQPASSHRDVEVEVVQGMINQYQSLKGRERVAVAMFLLSFALMGMNTPDIYECEPVSKGILHYFRHKTRNRRDDRAEMFVRIPEGIAPLVKEYSDPSKSHAFLFHRRYSSYKNLQDAEVKGMVKYKKRVKYTGELTNYSARHTWATIARSAACKVPMSIIDDCLDHVGSTTVGDIYAKKDYSVLWEANDKVLATLDWEPLGRKNTIK